MPKEIQPYVIGMLAVVGWATASWLASFASGWRDLAKFYRAVQPASGRRFRFQSAQMRANTNYGSCLTVAADMYGLSLSVNFILRIGHSPLFIPWEDVTTTFKRRWWTTYVELRFLKCPSIPLLISKRLADKLAETSGMRFQYSAAAGE